MPPQATAVILGSGTSNGVPTLGKTYPEAYLANPKNWRTRSSIVLQGPTGNLLVDASPELRLQLVRENIVDIDSVLITHTHADHIMGLDDVRAFCLKYKRAIDVYAWPPYQEDIQRIYPYAFRDFPPGIWVPRFELLDVPPVLEIGGLKIETLKVMHGPLPVVALRVNDFAYVTDVSDIPPETWDRLQGLNVLVLDAVRYAPHPNHFHFDRAVEVALQLGAKTTYLTHLSDDYDHDKVENELPPQIRLAFDGLRVPL